MLADAAAGASSVAVVRDRWDAALRRAVHRTGIEAVASASGVDPDRVEALAAGERPPLSLCEAAAVAATGRPETVEEVRQDVRDLLLAGLANRGWDLVELAEHLDGETPASLRATLEGEEPVALERYALLVGVVQTER